MKTSSSFTSSFRKKLLKMILSYLAIIVLLLLGIDLLFTGFIITHNKTTNYYRLHRLVYEDHPEEIPLFGSSTVLRGLLPEELGEDFYNYGITATNFQKLEPLLKVELLKNKSTPLIIEMPPPFFYERPQPNIRIEDLLPVIRQDDFKRFMMEYDILEPWHGIPGLRYFGYYSTYLASYADSNLPPGMHYSKGAKYVKKRTSVKKMEDLIQKRIENPVNFSASEQQIAKFKQLISSTNRPVILLVSPFHSMVYETGFQIEEYNKLFSEFEAQFPNVKGVIIDGRNYPDELFLDTSHLNYWGAKKYSNTLKAILDSLGIITQSSGK